MKFSEPCDKVIGSFYAAITLIEPPVKDKLNKFFTTKYVDLSGVREAIFESCLKNDLFVSQDLHCGDIPGDVYLSCRLIHASGQWIEFGPLHVPVKGYDLSALRPGDLAGMPKSDDGKTKGIADRNDPQMVKSAITYMRRTQLLAIFGLPEEDDDGNQAAGNAPQKQTQNSRPKTKSEKQPPDDLSKEKEPTALSADAFDALLDSIQNAKTNAGLEAIRATLKVTAMPEKQKALLRKAYKEAEKAINE